MKALAMLGTAVLFAVAPASIGFIGNASFSEDIPVRLPASATLLDSNGHQMRGSGAEAADERGRDNPARTATDGAIEKSSHASDDKAHDRADDKSDDRADDRADSRRRGRSHAGSDDAPGQVRGRGADDRSADDHRTRRPQGSGEDYAARHGARHGGGHPAVASGAHHHRAGHGAE